MSGNSMQNPINRQVNKASKGRIPLSTDMSDRALSSKEGVKELGNDNSVQSILNISSIGENEKSGSEDPKVLKELKRTRLTLLAMEWALSEGLSKSDMKLMAEGLALQFGLRTIPIGVAIKETNRSTKVEEKVEKPKLDQKAQKLAEYKKDPDWIKLNSERTIVVSDLKNTQKGTDEHGILVNRLRNAEIQMKDIKDNFTGKAGL
jgi:hypothetical protein